MIRGITAGVSCVLTCSAPSPHTCPPTPACLQDLKDHMRAAGDVGFSDVQRDRDGTFGVVEYGSQSDLDAAISKLDRSTIR